MTWLGILGIVVVLVAVVSVLGLQPKGGKPVARTRLMTVARVILLIFGIIIIYAGFRAR